MTVGLHDLMVLLDALDTSGVRCWLAGGWGVDALVGRPTRDHRDVDLLVDARDLDACLGVLERLGYTPETDWLPVRLELVAPGERWVDVHPVVFDVSGDGVQAGVDGTTYHYPAADLVTASLAGRSVPCVSAALQRRVHTGYELRPQDEHDLALLADLP